MMGKGGREDTLQEKGVGCDEPFVNREEPI